MVKDEGWAEGNGGVLTYEEERKEHEATQGPMVTYSLLKIHLVT